MDALSMIGRRYRRANLVLIPSLLLTLAVINPASWSDWVLFPTSCGAVTGLPCIFCGMTRGLHYLLQGDVGRAVYYNWLCIPFLLGTCLLLICNGLELAFGVNLIAKLPRPRSTPAAWASYATVLVVLWVFQVYLAVSQHKTELLNPRGPLYSLVVGNKY
jgi:hypothetical protein